MSLDLFLSQLYALGRVHVGAADPLSDDTTDWQRVDELLVACELQQRDELPSVPPELSIPAARHGAVLLYQACRFLVFREADADTVRQQLARPLAEPAALPAVHYSVDLTLQYLADVLRLARSAAEQDPLVDALHRLAECWPLSGVGVEQANLGDLAPIVAHASLRQLYVDRMLARHDYRALAHEPLRETTRQAIGAFAELAPEAAARLADGAYDQEAGPST